MPKKVRGFLIEYSGVKFFEADYMDQQELVKFGVVDQYDRVTRLLLTPEEATQMAKQLRQAAKDAKFKSRRKG